jgi:hypothetical protein
MDPNSSEQVDPDPETLPPKKGKKKNKWLLLELKSRNLKKVEAK